MRYIDTHTHLYDEAFGDASGQDAAVLRAKSCGVDVMIIPDECGRTRGAMLGLCSRHPGVLYPCLGLHPEEAGEGWRDEISEVENLIATVSPVAIGECGMDLYWTRENIEYQEESFRAQVELALKNDLPLVVHCRNASEEVFRILDSYRGRGLRGVFHAFSGSRETFCRMERYGDWYVGIGGVVTFRKASIAETVREIPLDRILLETDSPFLAPTPLRGTRNESANIPIIARFLAQQKAISEEEVAAATTENAVKLFGLALSVNRTSRNLRI